MLVRDTLVQYEVGELLLTERILRGIVSLLLGTLRGSVFSWIRSVKLEDSF